MRKTATIALALLGAVGLLHAPPGRSLMRLLGGRCPARGVSPAAAESLRQRGVRALRGEQPAPERPALGLALDRARLADARGWAAARGGSCVERARPSSLLICRNLPDYDEVTFAFAPDGRLVSVATLRERLPGLVAGAAFAGIRRQLAERLGDGALAGDPTASRLTAGPLHVARLQYRFADYLASVTAMNLPEGVALREQYQSARD